MQLVLSENEMFRGLEVCLLHWTSLFVARAGTIKITKRPIAHAVCLVGKPSAREGNRDNHIDIMSHLHRSQKHESNHLREFRSALLHSEQHWKRYANNQQTRDNIHNRSNISDRSNINTCTRHLTDPRLCNWCTLKSDCDKNREVICYNKESRAVVDITAVTDKLGIGFLEEVVVDEAEGELRH